MRAAAVGVALALVAALAVLFSSRSTPDGPGAPPPATDPAPAGPPTPVAEPPAETPAETAPETAPTPPGDPAPEPVDPGLAARIEAVEAVETWGRLEGSTVTVDLDEDSWADALRILGEKLGIEIRVAPDAAGAVAGRRGQASFESATGTEVLKFVADVNGLAVRAAPGGVELHRDGDGAGPVDPEVRRLVLILAQARRAAERDAALRGRWGTPDEVAALRIELPEEAKVGTIAELLELMKQSKPELPVFVQGVVPTTPCTTVLRSGTVREILDAAVSGREDAAVAVTEYGVGILPAVLAAAKARTAGKQRGPRAPLDAALDLPAGRTAVRAIVDRVRAAWPGEVVVDPRLLVRSVSLAGRESLAAALDGLSTTGGGWTVSGERVVIFTRP